MGIFCLISVAAALDFKYHHAEELEAYLKGVHAQYPSLTHLHSIGRSVEGRGRGAGGGGEGLAASVSRDGRGRKVSAAALGARSLAAGAAPIAALVAGASAAGSLKFPLAFA